MEKDGKQGRMKGLRKLPEPRAVPLGMPAVPRAHGAPGDRRCHKQAQNQGPRRGRKHGSAGAQGAGPEGGKGEAVTVTRVGEGIQAEGEARAMNRFSICQDRAAERTERVLGSLWSRSGNGW